MVYTLFMNNRRKYFNNWRKQQRINLVKKGLCSNNCGRPLNIKWFCRKCADKVNEYARNSYHKNIENRRKKFIQMKRYRFSGNWENIIKRDNHCCQICGYFNKIVIHHIDENNKNNNLNNLVILCRICHTVVERINKNRPNLKRILHWSK